MYFKKKGMYQKQKAIEKGLAQGKVVSADKWQTSTFKIIIRKILESQFQTLQINKKIQ